MDLAVERVALYCLAGVAGLAVLLQLAEEVALADFQRCVEAAESVVPNALWRRLGWLPLQWWLSSHWLSGAGLPNLCIIPLRGHSTEYLFHAWAKHTHHHLLEHAQESLVMPTQHSFRRIPKHLYTPFFLLKSRGVSLS
jgi:hypothetical protein